MSEFEEKFRKLNELAEEQRNQKMRLKGSLDMISKKLKEKGLKSPGEVRAKLKALKAEKEKLELQFNKIVSELEKKYADHL